MTAQKTDNHNLRAKLELRRRVLDAFTLKAKAPLSVLDCFSGEEVIWSTLRKEYSLQEYLALDVKPKRGRLKMDSLRYLQNQSWRHDVIDLDAYGSPWAHFIEVCKRVAVLKTQFAVFLTVGNSIMKNQPAQGLAIAGITFPVPPGISGQLADLVLMHCLAEPLRAGLQIQQIIEAANPGGSARYLGMQICGK